MALGERLKAARKARNLTQQQLADAVGWNQGGVGNIEARDSDKCLYSAEIAKALNISLVWLMTGNGTMEITGSDYASIYVVDSRKSTFIPIYSPEQIVAKKPEVLGKLDAESYSYQDIKRVEASGAKINFLFETVLYSDNMSPTIPINSAIRIDASKSHEPIRNSKVYALIVDNQLILRRLSNLMNGNILMYSDHSIYKEESVSREFFTKHVVIVGWVFDWSITDSW